MKELILVAVSLVAITNAQIPGIGWCPDKRAMAGFDIDRYLGTWYEAERYFTVLEAGSRCARTNYTKAVDGRIFVTNEITTRLTGIKRVLDGEIRNVPKGGVDSKITVKYSTLPFPMETEYIILETDYDTYSVVWSCSGLGPLVNTQTAWVMTRERLPPGTVLQKAYAVLDKHKISRTFFVRAEQEECNLGEALTAQKTRSTDIVTQHVDNPTSASSPPSEPPAPVNTAETPAVSEVSSSSSTVNEEEKKKLESTSASSQHQQEMQQQQESMASSSMSSSESSPPAVEEMSRPESTDTMRKPAPAITAAPPAQQQQNAGSNNQNNAAETNSVTANEQKKN